MIYGIGIDIVKIDRIKKWLQDGNMVQRFFNPAEMNSSSSVQASAEHYAARFAAKEAFGKALGTGLSGFKLQDVFVKNDEFGKPELFLQYEAAELLKKKCGNAKIHLSLTHEKEYALAYLIIEKFQEEIEERN